MRLNFRNGLIYFPDFCEVILKRYRQDDKAEESFRQNMFKVNLFFRKKKYFFCEVDYLLLQMLCGTEPFPTDFKAKKYKLDKHFLSKVRFLKSESKKKTIFKIFYLANNRL